jgi:4-alpha-glucanotransferase
LALDDALRTEDPEQERINVPGTVGGSNWAWRIKPSLEDLLERREFTALVRQIASKRGPL